MGSPPEAARTEGPPRTRTRFVEDFQGARLPSRDEQRALKLPSGVPVTRNIRTAYTGDQPVEVMDTISNGEAVSYRFEIQV
jgi:GntR family transcriptional regulator